MAELKGTFYGVSVGPGDPELMTLQAVRLIRQCPVLAAPQTASGQMLALDIARSALGEALDGKTIVPLYFAMSRDPAALAALHEKAAAAVRQQRWHPLQCSASTTATGARVRARRVSHGAAAPNSVSAPSVAHTSHGDVDSSAASGAR